MRTLFLVIFSACGTANGGGPMDGAADAGALDASRLDGAAELRFVTKVVSFKPGDCAGFGEPSLPDIVMGPPRGAGDRMGSLDVVSLGTSGEIVVSFEPLSIADGPGPDFIVFENAFFVAGDPQNPFADPGEVSVSADGVEWKVFPCGATTPPYGACSGHRPVYSHPNNGISPFDVSKAGGEAYDLADVGLKAARYLRVRDTGSKLCPTDPQMRVTNLGYDLDAVAVINAMPP